MWAFAKLLILALVAVAAAPAVDFAALKPEGYVSDFARVVDPDSRATLERYCRRLEDATGAQLAFVTLDTLGGEPIEDVANSIYRRWGVGRKGNNEGALLLIVVGDRRTRLEVGYGLEPIIPDGFAGSVLREMRPALRQRQYGEALVAAAETLGARIAAAKGVDLGAAPARRHPPRRERDFPWWMLLGGIAVLLWLLSLAGPGRGGGGGSFLAGMLLGNMMGRGLGRGGGGFGGFDSGDSFGGFGGGDSGGGGASSSW